MERDLPRWLGPLTTRLAREIGERGEHDHNRGINGFCIQREAAYIGTVKAVWYDYSKVCRCV